MGIMMIAGTERRRQGCSLQDSKQWGNGLTVYQNTTVYYPIPVIGIAAIIPYSYPQDGGVILTAYNSNTVSTILAAHDVNGNKVTANASFLLVGMVQPQWGVNRTNGIYSFPIPFTEALCCFGGGEAGSGYYDNASAYSNTQVRVYSDGSSRFVSWIAIGA